ncbi:unnamed protein product [Paramecium pentaurelia]|uniref:Serine carboxypeptidase S28 family protein n=1 Tax=Paramecium pentaurelia TaxID=43138 RepID=A0A8S1VJD6_9CILI|nr:unnamed protein product [Paramecium pentaurelia]
MYLILSALTICSYAIAPHVLTQGPFTETKQTFQFTQLLDHSDPANNQTWKQRYHVYSQYFNPTKGGVILYICGEWNCQGVGDNSFSFQLAKDLGAIVIALEHRFYGQSQPFGEDSWSLENLSYLNVHQALDDLAYFILQMKRLQLHNIDSTLPWYAIGGSYPGALSAWFRYKYPHLTVGNLASSGVINTILDFWQFDDQIRKSTSKSGEQCPLYLQLLNSYVDKNLKNFNTKQAFKESYRCGKMTDNEFRWFWADTIVQMIQQGQRTEFCQTLESLPSVERMAEYIREISLSQGDSYKQYGAYYLRNETIDENSQNRQWYFQCCTEVAYLQTPPQNKNSLRSYELTLDWWREWCNDAYSQGELIWPDVRVTEAYFGGLNLNVDHLIMTNGGEDPWQRASLTNKTKTNSKVITYLIDCDDCAHCVDLGAPSVNDPAILTQTRQTIKNTFKQWHDQFWSKILIQ